MSKAIFYTRWILIALVSGVSLWMSYLILASKMEKEFYMWGYPGWSPYLIGGVQVLGVVGLFFSKTFKWAIAFLSIISAGAVLTHVGHHEGWKETLPSVLTLLTLFGLIYLNAKQQGLIPK